jgi:hypothetical protein
LIISYKFTVAKLGTFEIPKGDAFFAKLSSILFTLAITGAIYDTFTFWVLIYPSNPSHITFYTINLYVINLLIMLTEGVCSLVIIPITRIVYAAVASFAYVGLAFLYRHIANEWVVDEGVYPSVNGLPFEVEAALGVVVVYGVSFLLALALVSLRNHIYNGSFTKEEKYHILESQSFK